MEEQETGRNGQVDDKRMNALPGRGDKKRHDDSKFAVHAAETMEGGKRSTEDKAIHAAPCRGGNFDLEGNAVDVPAAETIEGGNRSCEDKHVPAANGAGGNQPHETNSRLAPRAASSPATALLVARIVELDRARVHALRQADRIRKAADFFLADYLRSLDPETAAPLKARLAEAKRLREAVGQGEPLPAAVAALAEQVALDESIAARYAALQAAREREIKKLVRRLPVWDAWARDTLGLAELGVAVILGEAGDPLRYPNPAKLKKALGLAPPEVYPVGKTGGRKIPRSRKARVLRWVGDRACQTPDGPYRDRYLAWRAVIHARGIEWRAEKAPPKLAADGLALNRHGDLLARFKTGARLVCDFWAAWRAAEVAPDA